MDAVELPSTRDKDTPEEVDTPLPLHSSIYTLPIKLLHEILSKARVFISFIGL
jgi:hypothetical protein